MITLALDLNLIPMGVMPRLNVSQYDHGQNVECGLYDGTVPYSIPNGTTAVVQGTKADNTGFEYPCTIRNNEVIFKIADQMTVFAGDVTCEVVLLNGEDRIGTINFLLRVEPTALKDDITISETDLPLLQQIPEALLEAQTAAEDAQEWAEKSQEYAVGALHWKGNVAFANLPTSDLTAGDVYSVTNDFTTDSRFNEGAGIPCEAGTNIIWGTNGKWDLQARNAVYSFNGRKGAVVPASGDYTDELVTSSAITGKATVKAALQGLNTDKQSKTMSQAIAGQTTVEGCLSQLNTDLSVKSDSQELNTGLNGTCSIYKSGAMKQLSIYFNCTAGQLITLSGYIVTLTTNNRPRTSMVGVAGDQSGNLRYVSINSANGTVRVFGANLENVTTLSLSCLYM